MRLSQDWDFNELDFFLARLLIWRTSGPCLTFLKQLTASLWVKPSISSPLMAITSSPKSDKTKSLAHVHVHSIEQFGLTGSFVRPSDVGLFIAYWEFWWSLAGEIYSLSLWTPLLIVHGHWSVMVHFHWKNAFHSSGKSTAPTSIIAYSIESYCWLWIQYDAIQCKDF